MTEFHRKYAVTVLKNILHALHEKRYEDIPSCVDACDWADMEEVRECMQGTLELNDLDVFDEYGAPCNFHPSYPYQQLHFYEYNDGSGFALDYELTAGSELAQLCLQLIFLYQGETLKSIFHMIDPM